MPTAGNGRLCVGRGRESVMAFGIVRGVMIVGVGGGPMIGYGARRAYGRIIGA